MLGERSLTAVVRDIASDLQQIARSEIQLALTEVAGDVAHVKTSALLLVAGSAVAMVSLACVSLACVYLLATVMPAWTAALVVAAATGGVGGAFIAAGMKHMRQISFALPRTVATIEEHIQWANTPAK